MIELVTLRRGPCFGMCPVYQVTLRRDGSARWRGEFVVERQGEFVGEVSDGDFELLTELIVRSEFFTWRDQDPPGTCLADYRIDVRTTDGSRTVVQWGGSETLEFWTLAVAIDGIAANIEWRRP